MATQDGFATVFSRHFQQLARRTSTQHTTNDVVNFRCRVHLKTLVYRPVLLKSCTKELLVVFVYIVIVIVNNHGQLFEAYLKNVGVSRRSKIYMNTRRYNFRYVLRSWWPV